MLVVWSTHHALHRIGKVGMVMLSKALSTALSKALSTARKKSSCDTCLNNFAFEKAAR